MLAHGGDIGKYGHLAKCGVVAFDELLRSPAGDTEGLVGLILESHRLMANSAAQALSLTWRKVYTDASIILALSELGTAASPSEAVAKKAVRHLDLAIIIAGAPGPCRLELILNLIQKIQVSHISSSVAKPLLPFERSFDTEFLPSVVLPTAATAIPDLEEPPSLGVFRSTHALRPFILRGFVRDWPALTSRPWSSPDYLQTIAGPGRVVPVEIGSDYRADEWTQEIMPFDSFIEILRCPEGNSTTYLAQHNLLRQFPELRNDIYIPDYAYASPNPPPGFPTYLPPTNEDQLVTNVWLGPKGTVSPAHTVSLMPHHSY
jgi:hypothetical protein